MFVAFRDAVEEQFDVMKAYNLFQVEIEKDLLWDTYLPSFPPGTNPMFRERTEHDCQCCKHFIRNMGGVVSIVDDKLVSIWDIDVSSFYNVVAKRMSDLVKSCKVGNAFLRSEKTIGCKRNFQQLQDSIVSWDHFYVSIPKKYIVNSENLPESLGIASASKDVMLRSLNKITRESIDMVLDCIPNIYRGVEHKSLVDGFSSLKREFDKLTTDDERDLFCWSQLSRVPQSVARIRGTVIGTLLMDLSNGVNIEDAIASFESKVAPQNYKRPTALVTKGMVEKAREKIEELGFMPSLERRYATLEDISINNVIYADRSAKKRMTNVFDIITFSDTVKNFDRISEISINDFIANVLPKAESVELLFENRHSSNLVSLIAPVNADATSMFKWSNNFSWSYMGELADSIKERVKNAGGSVDGYLRCSLSWFNYDDLDLHMVEPDGEHIYFSNKVSHESDGTLDVDMNAGSNGTRTPVENICYPYKHKMLEGVYTLKVVQYRQRTMSDYGFDVEIEFDGTIHSFHHYKNESITVAQLKLSNGKLEIIESLPPSTSPRDVWKISTQKFHKVSTIMLSPNYWDEKAVGNKHFFFTLEGCMNVDGARGFYNEFLSQELDQHRKVLEVVGSKMKPQDSVDQLSGLGFSSTKRDFIICKVNGSQMKVIF